MVAADVPYTIVQDQYGCGKIVVKYLLIDSVDDEASPGKYLKREQILEVRDSSQANPWEPVPGLTLGMSLLFNNATHWSDPSIHTVSVTIYATAICILVLTNETLCKGTGGKLKLLAGD